MMSMIGMIIQFPISIVYDYRDYKDYYANFPEFSFTAQSLLHYPAFFFSTKWQHFCHSSGVQHNVHNWQKDLLQHINFPFRFLSLYFSKLKKSSPLLFAVEALQLSVGHYPVSFFQLLSKLSIC